jgi:hypothetical protein
MARTFCDLVIWLALEVFSNAGADAEGGGEVPEVLSCANVPPEDEVSRSEI